MKNKSYYSIHKNKKKRKSTLTESQKVWKLNGHAILSCLRIAFGAIEVAKALKKLSSIPDYTKGGVYNGNMIVNDSLSLEVLEWKGEIHDFPYFDQNVTINLPDNIPLNIGYEKNSYQEFKNKSFEM